MQSLRKFFHRIKRIPSYIIRPAVLKVGIGIVISIALLWFVPKWQVGRLDVTDSMRFQRENEARGTLAQIIGGVFLLAGLYFAWRRIEVAQEGQITERFTRAIEQLGSEKLEVRLGGIYALERIAKDSEKDHWTIMEVLTAYVRENAKWENSEAKNDTEEKADLVGADLKKANLTRACLNEANIWKANFKGAFFFSSNLKCAKLGEVNLMRASLVEANLENSRIIKAHMEGASFWKANLKGADLSGAKLDNSDLTTANLSNEVIWEASLKGTNLRGAVLRNAYLAKANFDSADFHGVHVQGASLCEANLDSVNIERASFDKAFLKGANLSGIIGWKQIRSMKLANVYGVKNPPEGFLDWAINTMGAVSIESDEEWNRLKAQKENKV